MAGAAAQLEPPHDAVADHVSHVSPRMSVRASP
jgi:hypothetical protein